MDPQIGWFQPEQGGRAKEFWLQIWDAHIFSSENLKTYFFDNAQSLLTKFQERIEHIPDCERLPSSMNHLNDILLSMNKASTYYMNRFQDSLIGKYGGCPWRNGSRYSTATAIGLHQEIEDFFRYISPSPEEHQVRLNVISNVKSVILSLWPNAQVEVFGSFQTALYLPTSDIDMVVIGEWEQLPLHTLEEALLSNGICESHNIKVLDKASVPIIKFNDRLSEVKVDISFNMNSGVKSVELIKHFCNVYPALKKLVLVLKQFLLQRNLNEVFHGGISSYSLILMCISFLQLHPYYDPYRSEDNLGILLIEFLELYGRKFNYSRVTISVKNGGSYIPKDQLPKDMTEGHRPSMLSIEDPLTQGNDIGRGSYGAIQVKHAFEYAFIVITQALSMGIDTNRVSVLGRIIRITDRVVDYRCWLKNTFPLLNPPSTLSTVASSSSLSNDGSVSTLSTTDSDSENRSYTSDTTSVSILPTSKLPKRVMNGTRINSATGYIRNDVDHNFIPRFHQSHVTDMSKSVQHSIGTFNIPLINHHPGQGLPAPHHSHNFQRTNNVHHSEIYNYHHQQHPKVHPGGDSTNSNEGVHQTNNTNNIHHSNNNNNNHNNNSRYVQNFSVPYYKRTRSYQFVRHHRNNDNSTNNNNTGSSNAKNTNNNNNGGNNNSELASTTSAR